jgi:hypothetical protein
VPNQIVATLNRTSQIGVQAATGVPVAATRKLNGMAFPMTPSEDIETFRPPGAKYDTGSAINREWSEGEIGDGSGLTYNEIPFVFAQVLSLPGVARVGSVAVARNTAYKVGDIRGADPANGHAYKCIVAGVTAAAVPTGGYPTASGATIVDGTATFQEFALTPINAWEYVFDTSTWDYDEVPLYTVETFDRRTGRGYQAADVFFTGANLSSSRGGSVGIGGDLLGGAVLDQANGFVRTANVAEDEMKPATPAHLNVYMDETPAAIGSTLLDGNFSAEWNIGEKAGHVWWHNRANRGPSGRVESPPEATAELLQADGEEVDGLFAALRAGTKRFFRYEFKGAPIIPGLNHLIECDFAGSIGDSRGFDDEENVWAATCPIAIQHSAEWGRAQRARVITTLPALG